MASLTPTMFFKYRRKAAILYLCLVLVSIQPGAEASSSSSRSSKETDKAAGTATSNSDSSSGGPSSTASSPDTTVAVAAAAPPAAAITEESLVHKCPQNCGNGRCDGKTGACECYPGWRGSECHLCGGKIKLNGTEGWLADALGDYNYTVDSKCTWLIEAPVEDATIRLHIKEFATECGWDHLYIFDGDSVFSDLRAVYSGMVRQDRYQVQRVPELVGTSGSMLLHFYSDVAYNMSGFNITFSVNSCPTMNNDLTCSGHGRCDEGRCVCDADFKGTACAVPACPGNCAGVDGKPRGLCNKSKKKCDCYPGYTGASCSQSISHGFWRVLTQNDVSKALPTPRTSHSAMVDEFGTMWVVGGETFSMRTRHLVATWKGGDPKSESDDIANGFWSEVRAKSDKVPSARYGHSAVIHDRKIYMYGGTMGSGHTSHELWALDLDMVTWSRVDVDSGQCLSNGDRKLCGPLHSMGHTANVISNRMIVIFGHSPKYGYLNTVQMYHFGVREWSIIDTKGYPVKGGFGHSSVWDEINQKVYVYGGYVSMLSTSASITDELYSFDPQDNRWTRHASSGSFRYLHTAVASHGLMVVFGGNTHNDTSFSHGAKCFSADLMVYDIVCDRWYNAHDSIPKDFGADMARFGHSAVVSNGTMLVHGGFHGVLKNDLLAYVPGECQMFKVREDCLGSRVGVKCVWDSKKDKCEKHPPNRPKSGIETCLEGRGARNETAECASLTSCGSCVSTSFGCVWCTEESRCSWKDCSTHASRTAAGLDAGFVLGRPETSAKLGSGVGGGSGAGGSKTKAYLTRLAECQEAGLESGPKELCEEIHTCHSCMAHPGCGWETNEKIANAKCRQDTRKKSTASGNLTDDPNSTSSPCKAACSDRKTCGNCTEGMCMWCKNIGMCIDRNAYLASFPYGQCMDWTTQREDCPVPSKNESLPADICVGYDTCNSCRSNPSCGWCDDGSLTGVGVCHLGGAQTPLRRRTLTHAHFDYVDDGTVCKRSDGMSWHFTSCPDCQCNGHSRCNKDRRVCDQPCQDFTEGGHCEKCTKGYFGNAVNGGKCQACQCNGQASTCNHQTGRCHCTTKGIIGDHCEKCDKGNQYDGDPVRKSCFYDLAIDYQFTFNLSKSDDKHFTAINFKNEPTKMDVDVDFSISCSVLAKMNITYIYTPANSKEGREEVLYQDINCTLFKEKFSKDDYVFGENDNTTFFVYVYDFEPPLWIIISFSQHPKLDLLQFFITFSTCFIALLIVAAVLWKIKQRYDRYRRRQRLFVEMEQMASRPFGSVLVEMERLPESSPSSTSAVAQSSSNAALSSASGTGSGAQDISSEEVPTTVRKRKKRYRPSPIALEPCDGNRAAVLSLIVRLPTAGKRYAPPGYTGIAVASSLVTLGNPRKASTDVSSRQNMDDPKRAGKGRKGHGGQAADI